MAAKRKALAQRLVLLALLLGIAAVAVWLVLRQRAPEEIVLSGTLEARTVNVGSLVGGLLFGLLGLSATGLLGNLIVATVGAIAFLYLLRQFNRKI